MPKLFIFSANSSIFSEPVGLISYTPRKNIMLEIGAGGELVVAYFRFGLSALLLLLPLASFLFKDSTYEILSGLIGVGFALLISFY